MIELDDETNVPRRFLVCDFYGVETFFCWCSDNLVTFPYTKGTSTTPNTRVSLSTPDAVRKIQCYGGRAFLICAPLGVYKLSRTGEFAVLSKNALAMGAEYWEVIVAYRGGVYLDDKQTKSSRLLFQCPTIASKTTEDVHTLPLNLDDTETEFVDCLIANRKAERSICVLGHDRRLFVLRGDTVHLIYTSDVTIVDIAAVKRGDKVAGLMLHLVEVNTVVLVNCKDHGLVFEKVHVGRNAGSTAVLCAGFSLQAKDVIWITYCDQSSLYYLRKVLFSSEVSQQALVDERAFRYMQHYKADVILGLSQENELVEFSVEKLESSISVGNNIGLRADMFQKMDVIMERICAKANQLNALNKELLDEQDKLRRINLYASKQRFKLKLHIEMSRLCNYCYLTLSIPDKLPKNSHVVFTFNSRSRYTFCVKEVTDTTLTIRMPINESNVLCSSSISVDLITLMEQHRPWCLIRDFINDSPSQDLKRKRGRSKQDKTVFIDTKIMSLRKLIEEKDLSMTKLREIKRVIRAELQDK